MSIEDLLGQIEDILEEGKRSLVGDKVRVDAEAIRSIIADIKISMPDEVIQARKIAAERKVILAQAQDITRNAQVNAAEIVADAKKQASDIIERAKANSNEIVDNAQKWATELRNGATSFVDTIMNESDEILSQSIDDFTKSLNKVRIASQQLKSAT